MAARSEAREPLLPSEGLRGLLKNVHLRLRNVKDLLAADLRRLISGQDGQIIVISVCARLRVSAVKYLNYSFCCRFTQIIAD